MPKDVRSFFRQYIAGYDALDASQIASHYTVPAVVCDSIGVQSFNSVESLDEKMLSYCKSFESAGYQGASYTCDAYHSLGADACFVDLEWTVMTREDKLVYKTAYLLHKSKGSWKINHATVYGV